jgi:hypothetical protein
MNRRLAIAAAFSLAATAVLAQNPADSGEIDRSNAMMRPMIERFQADRTTLERSWVEGAAGGGFGGRGGGATPFSPRQFARMKKFHSDWQKTLGGVAFDSLDQTGKIDYLLLSNQLRYELRQIDLREKEAAEIEALLPMAKAIHALDEARRAFQPVKGDESARTLNQILKDTQAVRASLDKPAKPPTREQAVRASATIARLRTVLKEWSEFYNGYDPLFSWWTEQSVKDVDAALDQYSNVIRDKFGSSKSESLNTSVVNPVGRDMLLADLEREMIAYTPEELIAIANAELAWSEREMLKATREMGFGDDWRKALEKVKTMHPAPGDQPSAVRDLVLEGAAYVEKHELVTVPALVKETWRMQMLSPQRQLVSPFFLGGETIMVAFPTDTMTFDQKMMSLRANNLPFSRAVAHHEMVPGHQLQGFMSARYKTYRAPFGTPFWSEGNAFWFEMLFWDMGFPRTPEERIGMLFWRMHRSIRIVFSLSYHLGKMSPQEAIDMLVNRGGHELGSATAEVRRSFDGSYPPLYQCAYMLGALQFRSMHKELVLTKKMTNRAFHDAILKSNRIPVEMIHADMTNKKLTRDYATSWKFYGPIPSNP